MDTQQARTQHHSNLLTWHIEAWQQVQVLFMPGISTLRSDWSELMDLPPSMEDIPLFLLSHINGRVLSPHPLNVIEFQLRQSQAHDTLNDLHQGLVLMWSRSQHVGLKLPQSP